MWHNVPHIIPHKENCCLHILVELPSKSQIPFKRSSSKGQSMLLELLCLEFGGGEVIQRRKDLLVYTHSIQEVTDPVILS